MIVLPAASLNSTTRLVLIPRGIMMSRPKKPPWEYLMPLSNAEIDALLSVLWHTHAIRSYYEDRALFDDERMWKRNGGVFPSFSRYHSERWRVMMGPDDPTVRGRRISSASMSRARADFERSYREPVTFALELAERIIAVVAKAIDRSGPSQDGQHEDEIGAKAWEKLASDPVVRERLMKIARDWCNVDASSFRP